jgi:hypothetical protein
MGTITVNNVADGQTVTAASVNTPINTIVAAINGNLDATNLAAGAVTNAKMATDIAPYTVLSETMQPFVASGFVIPTSGSLSATTPSGVAYITGKRLSVAADPHTYTASKDTYVDLDSTGALTYTAVSNNAASPSLAANSIRLGIVITSASAVTTVNQGDPTAVLPIASSVAYSVTDSLGNLICNRNPNPTLLGYREILTGFTSATAGNGAAITGLTACPVQVPAGGARLKGTLYSYAASTAGVAGASVTGFIWETSVGTNGFATAQVGGVSNQSDNNVMLAQGYILASAGIHTYLASYSSSTGTNATMNGSARPNQTFLAIERV